MQKIALVTQSYRDDFEECRLLCESIDRFARDMMHFIFVNDEDEKMFRPLEYGNHKVLKKGTIMPWYFFRLPFKFKGHRFKISPLSLPVRGWIEQQICKLGIFDIIGKEYDAVLNIDSECVLMKPLVVERYILNGGG